MSRKRELAYCTHITECDQNNDTPNGSWSVPILISLFLQLPIGGQPDLLRNSSSKCSNLNLGPRILSLYQGNALANKTPSKK